MNGNLGLLEWRYSGGATASTYAECLGGAVSDNPIVMAEQEGLYTATLASGSRTPTLTPFFFTFVNAWGLNFSTGATIELTYQHLGQDRVRFYMQRNQSEDNFIDVVLNRTGRWFLPFKKYVLGFPQSEGGVVIDVNSIDPGDLDALGSGFGVTRITFPSSGKYSFQLPIGERYSTVTEEQAIYTCLFLKNLADFEIDFILFTVPELTAFGDMVIGAGAPTTGSTQTISNEKDAPVGITYLAHNAPAAYSLAPGESLPVWFKMLTSGEDTIGETREFAPQVHVRI